MIWQIVIIFLTLTSSTTNRIIVRKMNKARTDNFFQTGSLAKRANTPTKIGIKTGIALNKIV